MEQNKDFEIMVEGNRIVFFDVTRQDADGLYKSWYSFLYYIEQGISNRRRAF